MRTKRAQEELSRAFALHQRGDFDAALQAYAHVLRGDPRNVAALNKVAEIGIQRKDLDSAIQAYQKSLKVSFEQEDVFINLSFLLYQAGRYEESSALAQRGLKLFKGNSDLRLNAANAMTESGEPSKAIQIYEELLLKTPDDLKLRFNLARALFKAGDKTAALKKFLELGESNPSLQEIHTNLASVYLSLGQPKQALESMARAESIGPLPTKAKITKIAILSATENFECGLKLAKDVLLESPKNLDAMLAGGHLLVAWGRANEAEELFHAALKLDPESTDAYRGLAVALCAAKRHADALPIYSRVLKINPRDLDARIGISIAHRQAGSLDQARQWLTTDGYADKDAAYILIERSEWWAIQGRLEEALQDAQRATEFDPENAKAWESLGNAQSDAGLTGGARASYKRSIEINPSAPKARTGLALLDFRGGNFPKGLEGYRHRWRNSPTEIARYEEMGSEWDCKSNPERLLVWGEQGVGDQVLYSQALGYLHADGCRVLVEVDRRLLPVYSRSFPQFEFRTQDVKTPTDDYDRHIPMPELFFNLAAGNSTSTSSYLKPDVIRVQELRSKYADGSNRLVGLSWRSKGGVANKSFALDRFAELFRLPDLRFVCLQYGDVSDDLRFVAERFGVQIIYPEVDLFEDLDGLFALTSACDHVVTTSNVTAHIAGAVGVKTSLVVPKVGRGLLWYWANRDNQQHSRWYPNVRILSTSSNAQIEFDLAWIGS
jgi:tetratricopeptide (TPR) repeat protein